MGWFALLFPAEASEKARLQQEVLQMQQHIQMQAGLIARMNVALIHLRAENAVLNKAGAFLENKVERFQAAAAAMLRDNENILSHNPMLRSVLLPGAASAGSASSSATSHVVTTLVNHAPTPSRDHLEIIRRAANNIRKDNYASVIGAPDFKNAIAALEMWADNPCVGEVLLATFILSMG